MAVLDFEGPTPLYLQLAGILRDQIMSGAIAADRPIPSKRSLIEQYEVGARTVDRAVDVLRSEGLLYTAKGKGLFVRRSEP